MAHTPYSENTKGMSNFRNVGDDAAHDIANAVAETFTRHQIIASKVVAKQTAQSYDWRIKEFKVRTTILNYCYGIYRGYLACAN